MHNKTISLTIGNFGSLDQSVRPETVAAGDSPDCVNMDTDGGALRTAAGHRRLSLASPGGGVTGLGAFYRRSDGASFLLMANAQGVFACPGEALNGGGAAAAWTPVYLAETRMGDHVSFINYQDGDDDVLLIADGVNPVLVWQGYGLAAPREGITHTFGYMALSHERLWGAGAADAPDEISYSRSFNITNWSPDASDPDEGGGSIEIPTWNGGSVRGVYALFNEVVVFKDSDAFRISGAYPGEYSVSRITGDCAPVSANALCDCDGTAYFWSKEGLCAYDGISVRCLNDRRAVHYQQQLNTAAFNRACAVSHWGKLYFALPTGGSDENDIVLEYDLRRGALMARRGIQAAAFIEFGGRLLFATPEGELYEYGAETGISGEPAYWRTPVFGAGEAAVKQIRSLTLSGRGRCHISAYADGCERQAEVFLSDPHRPRTLPLNIRGRSFALQFQSVNGEPFEISGDVVIVYELEERA